MTAVVVGADRVLAVETDAETLVAAVLVEKLKVDMIGGSCLVNAVAVELLVAVQAVGHEISLADQLLTASEVDIQLMVDVVADRGSFVAKHFVLVVDMGLVAEVSQV